MYPEIRLIGTIQAIEEPVPGKPDLTATISTRLRDGRTATFRARAPRGDVLATRVGDEVVVLGELDETGAITLLHGGMLRTLAPHHAAAREPSTPPPTPTATPKASAPAEAAAPPSSSAPSPAPAERAKPEPTIATAAKPTTRPVFAAGKAPYGGLFGQMKIAPRPSPTPPAASPSPAPAAAARVAAFGNARRADSTAGRQETATTTSPPNTRQGWDAGPAPSTTRAKSELAEYLQDEIPW